MYVKYLILCFVSNIVAESNVVKIEIKNGVIAGRTVTSIQNKTIFTFLEIPYAQPPVGNLRFKEPQPAKNWTGVLNTTENTKICWEARYHMNDDDTRQNEDCLYLNVYSPVPPGPNNSLPVWVYIYGGRFLFGHATEESIDPQLIVDSGVVAVTLNYRSGPLGFLTTEDGVIPANLGLRDQHLALIWIQENIHFFGGDPSKVVIAGQSSGAACVSHQVISPRTAGLFRGAIIQSAVAINSFSVATNARFMAFEMGKYFLSNFSADNSSQELLHMLLKAPARTITYAEFEHLGNEDNFLERYFAQSVWRPVIERSDLPNAYLTRLPHNALVNGDFQRVPLLTGITSEESLYYEKHITNWGSLLEKNPIFFENTKVRIGFQKYVERRLKRIYTNATFTEDFVSFISYLSDYFFTIPIIRNADLHSRYADTYFYQFSYYGKPNELFKLEHKINVKGLGNVAHAEELPYLIFFPGTAADFEQFLEADRYTSERLVKLWTNFVKYLNPTPEEDILADYKIWPKTTRNNFSYVDINNNITIIKRYPRAYKQWIPVIEDYLQHPLGTL